MERSLALSIRTLLSAAFAAAYLFCDAVAAAQTPAYDFNDSHFHLTNNIQEGPDIRDFYGNVYFDISWDEVAKYFVGNPEETSALRADAALPGPLSLQENHGPISQPGKSRRQLRG